MAEHPDAEHRDIGAYVEVLRRRRWTIVLVALGVVSSALLVSALQRTTYQATSEVLLQARRQVIFGQDGSGAAGKVTTVETEIRVLRSDPVRAAVRDKAGSAPNITATRAGETEVMKIQALGRTGREAAMFANVYAEAYVEFRKQQAVADLVAASNGIRDKVTALQEELDGIERRLSQAPATERASLEASLRPRYSSVLEQQSALKQRQDELQVEAELNTGDAQVLRKASVPSTPIKPKPIRNGVAGGVVGLLLGVGLAFLREQLDDSVSSREDLRQALPTLPVLGMIPTFEGGSDRRELVSTSSDAVTSPAAEAFRALRTSVRFLGVERALRTIQVTSPTSGDGKTTVVANLAAVLSASGERVVVIDADLRRPGIHRLFGLDNAIGLTSVFLEEVSLESALHRASLEVPLFVLPAGPIPPNPSELLSAKRMAELLFRLQETFDVVLVDAPPVLPVTDATVLSAWMEATLLVARAGVTTSTQLRRSFELLRQVDAPVKGTVLNQAELEMTYGYHYETSVVTPPGERGPLPKAAARVGRPNRVPR